MVYKALNGLGLVYITDSFSFYIALWLLLVVD